MVLKVHLVVTLLMSLLTNVRTNPSVHWTLSYGSPEGTKHQGISQVYAYSRYPASKDQDNKKSVIDESQVQVTYPDYYGNYELRGLHQDSEGRSRTILPKMGAEDNAGEKRSGKYLRPFADASVNAKEPNEFLKMMDGSVGETVLSRDLHQDSGDRSRSINQKMGMEDNAEERRSAKYLQPFAEARINSKQPQEYRNMVNGSVGEEVEPRKRKDGNRMDMDQVMMPLLMAYKLKFTALIPLMLGGLALLVSSTALAGFFFALFTAVLGLKAR